MIVGSREEPRFADADDEDTYQAARANPILRDKHSCRLKEGNKEVEESDAVRFDPALYIQRYAKVVELCRKHHFRRVADFGTAELTLVNYLKNVDFVNQIVAVDIDRGLLETSKHRCKPLMFDYMTKRAEPLNISILCGSVLEPDPRLHNLDCIFAIEIIEHLQKDQVDDFAANIFGALTPSCAVISTPNKDFNVLFDFKSDDQMRHWDHKFEWTRSQFYDYCERVKELYGYEYELDGVGNAPEEGQDLGYCSQFAIFTRISPNENQIASGDHEPVVPSELAPNYEEIYSVDYPVKDPSITPDDHLRNELQFLCRQIGAGEYDQEGVEVSEVPIRVLQEYPSVVQYGVSDAHIVELARQCEELEGVSEDGERLIVRNVPDSPVLGDYEESEDEEEEEEDREIEEVLVEIEDLW